MSSSQIRCPRCSEPLPPAARQCPRCGLSLTGPAAVELWQVDQRLTAVTAERRRLETEHAGLLSRRAVLIDQLATPVAPAAVVDQAPMPTPVRTPMPAPAPAPLPHPWIAPPGDVAAEPAPPRRPWTVQQTLLAVGVVLVLVAGSIALAVAWDRIGVYGQAVVMGSFTALAGWLALLLSRRCLASSAEALALVAGGLMLLDVAAARALGLFGLDATPTDWYAAGSGLVVALLLGALHVRDRRIAAFAILSLTAASVAWGGLVAVGRHHGAAWEATALLGAAVFGLLRWRLPARLGLIRTAASGPAAAWLVLAALTAAGRAALTVEPDLAPAWTATAVLDVALLVVVWAAGAVVVRAAVASRTARLGSRAAVKSDWLRRWFTGDWRALGVVAVASTAALPVAAWLTALLGGRPGTIAVVGCVVLAWVAVVATRPLGDGRGGQWLEGVLALAALGLVPISVGHGTSVTVAGLLAVSAGATATAVRRPAVRLVASGGAVLCAVLAVQVAIAHTPATTRVLVLLGAMTALTAAALVRRERAEEPALAGGVVLGALFAFATASTLGDQRWAVSVVAAVSASAVAYAVWRRSLRTAAAAVAVLTGQVALAWAGGLASPAVQVGLLVAAGCGLTAAALLRPGRDEQLPLAAGAVLALAGGWADAELRHGFDGLAAGWVVVATLAIAACALVVGHLHRRVGVPGWAMGVLALWHAVDVAAALVAPELRVLALAGLAAAYTAGALARPRRPEELPLAGGAALSVGTALWLALDRQLPTPYLIVVLLVVCAGALATAVLRAPLRLPSHAAALASGAWLLWLVGGYGPHGTDVVLVAALALACVALARWRHAADGEELLFGVASAVLVAVATWVAQGRGWDYAASGVAAAYGLALMAYAAWPARRLVVAPAVASLTFATWVALAHAGVDTVEAYSLPLAVYLLAAGVWCRHLLGRRSWLVAGPGLLVGFVPPTWLTVTDAGAVRPLLTAAAAVTVLVLGAGRRWQALVVVGATCAAVVALSELGPYTLHLPRSVTLGALGALLLAVGARYEQRRTNARQAVSWLASMT